MSFIIGIPSGEILNCNSNNKYDLFILGFIKYKKYYNSIFVDKYIFRDNFRNEIFNIIANDIKIGTKIKHIYFGEGILYGLIGDGWVVHFNNKKSYVDKKILITNTNYSFIDE